MVFHASEQMLGRLATHAARMEARSILPHLREVWELRLDKVSGAESAALQWQRRQQIFACSLTSIFADASGRD